jgi:hypothetical protein
VEVRNLESDPRRTPQLRCNRRRLPTRVLATTWRPHRSPNPER